MIRLCIAFKVLTQSWNSLNKLPNVRKNLRKIISGFTCLHCVFETVHEESSRYSSAAATAQFGNDQNPGAKVKMPRWREEQNAAWVATYYIYYICYILILQLRLALKKEKFPTVSSQGLLSDCTWCSHNLPMKLQIFSKWGNKSEKTDSAKGMIRTFWFASWDLIQKGNEQWAISSQRSDFKGPNFPYSSWLLLSEMLTTALILRSFRITKSAPCWWSPI